MGAGGRDHMVQTDTEPQGPPQPVLVVLGENLYRRRVMHLPKMSRRDLAAKSGVSENTIAALENGRDPNREGKPNYPQLDTVEKLAVALGCSVADLFRDTRAKFGGRPRLSPLPSLRTEGQGRTPAAVQAPLIGVARS